MITTRDRRHIGTDDTLGLFLPDPETLQNTSGSTATRDSDFTINTDDCSLGSDSSFY